MAGKRVAVIGTGATGVQVISEIADRVDSLTVFQRRPNWCAPLHNSPISKAEMHQIRSRYQEIFDQCRSTPNGFLHGPDRRVFEEVSVEDRHAFWEELYASPGFGIWLGNFRDVLMDPAANAEFSAFVADKIRGRVHDPVTAEKLIPTDHGFGTRRVPLETRYYEAYNYDHVRLVDINETPIERITPEGIQTTEELHEFDLIVYATGFDAISGSYDRMEIIGRDDLKLADKWRDGPVTYMGMQVHGFPNLFTLAGPQSASVGTNFPLTIESVVEWTANFIEYLNEHGYETVEATRDAEQAWVEHVKSGYDRSLLANSKSWFTGYNSNVKGHDVLRYMIYLQGGPAFREHLVDEAAYDYTSFRLQ
ncbi:MAG: NAD(P)/FAD-dependent oxidoreductase, partial [Gammaproteobacteria bacterium]|nr:NAD(P)/FAD-dependent oxidoreductase [Gammaproteobacteria bacterium]